MIIDNKLLECDIIKSFMKDYEGKTPFHSSFFHDTHPVLVL